MNGRERVKKALARQVVHPWPWGELCLADELVRDYLACPEVSFKERLEFMNRLALDLVCLTPDDSGWQAGQDLPGPAAISWPDLKRWSTETNLFTFILLEGPFSWGCRLAGLAGFLTNLMRRPDEAADFMNQVARLNAGLAEKARDQGADGILLADDIAYQRGSLVDPELLRKIYFPALDVIAQNVGALNLPLFFHSDGNLNALLDDLAALDLAGLQCLESAAAMDLVSIQAKYGHKWCLWGNLDPGCLTGPLDRSGLQSKVAGLAPAALQGGFIFGTSSGLFAGISPQSLGELKKLLRPE